VPGRRATRWRFAGGPDPVTAEPLASVCINEWQNHSDPEDWIELYNHGNNSVDISGAWLSDDPPPTSGASPTTPSSRPRLSRLDQTQLGFELFAGGETVFFVNSNQTRVIDVIDFRGQSNNVSSGRSPDGGSIHYGLATGRRAHRTAADPLSGGDHRDHVQSHFRQHR